jgi:hypothetical protein
MCGKVEFVRLLETRAGLLGTAQSTTPYAVQGLNALALVDHNIRDHSPAADALDH